MRAVKIADADVHDSGPNLAAIVARNGHIGVQLRQGFLVQAGHVVPSGEHLRRAETTRRNCAWRSAWKAAAVGSGSAARWAGGASGPWISSKLSRSAACAPKRAAPRPDAAGTST